MMLLYGWLSILPLILHPFHVSVSSIYYAPEEQALQITMKIFADDLEEALNAAPYRAEGQAYVDVLNPVDPTMIDEKIEQYIRQHFSLMVNEKKVEPVFLGYELEDLAMWCYLEVKNVPKLQSLRVRSTLLTETFDDQTNIVHVDYQDAVKSMKLTGDQLTDELIF